MRERGSERGDSGLLKTRPKPREGQVLNVSKIRVGKRCAAVLDYPKIDPKFHCEEVEFTAVGAPPTEREGTVFVVGRTVDGRKQRFYLADLCVIPYSEGGFWNQTHWLKSLESTNGWHKNDNKLSRKSLRRQLVEALRAGRGTQVLMGEKLN